MKSNDTTIVAIIAATGLLAFNPAIRAQDANKQANPAVARMASPAPTEVSANSAPTYEEVKGWITAYKAAHPGNGGKDWDINKKKPSEIAADSAAQQLMSLCGKDQRPVIPLIAWEYGGHDHQWINPEASALIYCVYTPCQTNSEHWKYDKATDHVTADVYVKFPEQNPCKNETGAAQVMSCLGNHSNVEILVDTASIHDGKDVGLDLSESSTDLYLLLPDGSRTLMYQGK